MRLGRKQIFAYIFGLSFPLFYYLNSIGPEEGDMGGCSSEMFLSPNLSLLQVKLEWVDIMDYRHFVDPSFS